MPTMQLQTEDLDNSDVRTLLSEHLAEMHQISPNGCVHALDLDGLKEDSVTLWTARDSGTLLGCGALKELDPRSGEIKSMRTAKAHLRKGVARALLDHLLEEARQRNYQRVSLETGASEDFEPARLLYQRAGFRRCGPFGDYAPDPFSVFMTLNLYQKT